MVESRVAASVLMLACACFHLRGCLCSQVRYRSGYACRFHQWSGCHVHFRPRTGQTYNPHPHLGPQNTKRNVFRPARRRNVTEQSQCSLTRDLVYTLFAHAMERYRYSKVIRKRDGMVPSTPPIIFMIFLGGPVVSVWRSVRVLKYCY